MPYNHAVARQHVVDSGVFRPRMLRLILEHGLHMETVLPKRLESARQHLESAARPQSKTEQALALLRQSGLVTASLEYSRRKVIVAQGSPAETLFFLQRGAAKSSIVSKQGKQAVTTILTPGSFFGEACLAGRATYTSSVEALVTCAAIPMKRHRVLAAIQEHRGLAELLMTHWVKRSLRTEEDLAYQLFTSSERRLALILVKMSEIDEASGATVLRSISQETLAQMVGTTRSRINLVLNEFRRQGLIHYDGGLHVRPSLATIVQGTLGS